MNKETKGGKKLGRPKSEPTKVITFRVRLVHEQAIRDVVKAETKRLIGCS